MGCAKRQVHDGEETSNEWLEPVDDEEYLKATDNEA